MVYLFVTVPLKKSKAITQNNQIVTDVPCDELKTLKNFRTQCLHTFESVEKQPSDSLTLESNFTLKMLDQVKSYVTNLINLSKQFPSFRVKLYYAWSSALGENTCSAYDDYRYELVAIYYNLGAYFLNLAHHLLCVRAKVGGTIALEKDSYRTLLKAAGYFSLIKDVVNDIKLQSIGVAEMPFACDNVIALWEFLESLSVAQAQEIGTIRALQGDPRQCLDLPAKLSHQVLLLYKRCNELSGKIKSSSKDFLTACALCEIKSNVFSALTYSYAASSAFTSSPPNGLWFLNKSKTEVHNMQKRYEAIKRKQKSLDCKKLLENCLSVVRRNDERLSKINSLVHGVKMSEGHVPLPQPQVLAIKEKIHLPVQLPKIVNDT